MRRISLYRFLALLCLGAAAAAVVLAAVALGLAHAFEAGAAGACAAVFFVPGLLFLRYWRQLSSRDLALEHVARIAEEAGVADAKDLAQKLEVPEMDATKILRIAIREGRLRGEVDAKGWFVATSAPRCASCGTPVPRAHVKNPCPACGRPIAGSA